MKKFKEPFKINIGKITYNEIGKTRLWTEKNCLKNAIDECEKLAKDYKIWDINNTNYLHIEIIDNNGVLVYLLKINHRGEIIERHRN